jgi:divalent metal cation (Fe/Co/Zn/Cd) transporter
MRANVIFSPRSVRAGHAISHQVENSVRTKVDRVADVLVHIEPEEAQLNPTHSQM